MTDKALDHWRDRMVEALYGELDEEQMREFAEQLERDGELAQEWRELNETRASLARLAEAEPVPEHRLSTPLQASRRFGKVTTFPRWRWALASAAGFAAAATLFLALLVAGLRVDHTPAGLLVRFSGGAGEELSLDPDADSMRRAAVSGGRQQYLTRAEFAAMAQMMMDATANRLEDLERRQSSSQFEMTRALYDALAVSQQRGFDELSAQVQVAAYRVGGANPYGGSSFEQPQITPPMKENKHDYD
jgi:hypothetical protein